MKGTYLRPQLHYEKKKSSHDKLEQMFIILRPRCIKNDLIKLRSDPNPNFRVFIFTLTKGRSLPRKNIAKLSYIVIALTIARALKTGDAVSLTRDTIKQNDDN